MLLLRYTNIIIVVYEACEIYCQYTIFSMVEKDNKKNMPVFLREILRNVICPIYKITYVLFHK